MIYHKPKTCPGCDKPKTTLSFMIPSAVDSTKKRVSRHVQRLLSDARRTIGDRVDVQQDVSKTPLTYRWLPCKATC